MLGRIASASAVAALPWAGVLVAASSGELLWVGLGSAATLAILLWGFAPHIPYLRKLVPGQRRIWELEDFWKEGKLLALEAVKSEEDLQIWLERLTDWINGVGNWVEARLSIVEAERFRRPDRSSVSYSSAFDERHNNGLILVNTQLGELIRLRDEEEAKLK